MRSDEAYVTMREFEESVNSYLSANWKLFRNGDAQFVYDPQLQYAGVDISCSNGLCIDSKIKNTKSINEIFQWPSVEITIKHNQFPGWFVNPNTKTHAYLYISVFSDRQDYRTIREGDIKKLNCMLFSKKALTEYVERYVSIGDICEDARTLTEYDQRKDYRDENGRKVFHLKYSPYGEGAVNLVLNRDVYLGLKGTREFEL